jgi:hypothetical protein
MDDSRKKPGWAFWIAVAISLMSLYALGTGPAVWLYRNDLLPEQAVLWVYAPVVWLVDDPDAPLWDTRVAHLIAWYVDLWVT